MAGRKYARSKDGKFTFTTVGGESAPTPVSNVVTHSKYGAADSDAAVDVLNGDVMIVNKHLRSGVNTYDTLPGEEQDIIDRVDATISKGSMNMDVEAYRVVPASVANKLKKGATYTDEGYTSVTLKDNIAKDIAHSAGIRKPVQMKVQVPKGTKAFEMNKAFGKRHRFDWQNEVVLPRGTKFKVKSRTKGSITVEVTG